MNPCDKSAYHNEIKTPAHRVEVREAGELSGWTVTPATTEASKLPQMTQSTEVLPVALPVDKPKNGRDVLREKYCKIDDPSFARFCTTVEEVYVQTRFHCTIDQLTADDMTQVILEHHDSLQDMATVTLGMVVSDPGGSEQLTAASTGQPASADATGILHQRFQNLYPWYNHRIVWRLTHYLNKDCQLQKGCQLNDLGEIELFEFAEKQLMQRAKQHKGLSRKVLDLEHLSEEEIIVLFSTSLPVLPKQRIPANRLVIPARLYRLGTFMSNEDEMGRVKNYRLGKLSFDLQQVNCQSTSYGLGLYVAQNAAHCRGYRVTDYNLNKPLAILEVTTGKDTNLVDHKYTTGYTKEEWSSLYSNQPRTIIRTTKLEFLVKDPRCLVNIKAFHPSMLTKVHIPFSQEEITIHRLQAKMISEEDFALLDHVKTLHNQPIADTRGFEAGIRDILECRVGILPDQVETRGLARSKYYEVKFYARSLAGRDFVRVKPAAPINNQLRPKAKPEEGRQLDAVMDYDLLEFHVQYHLLRGAGAGEVSGS